MEIAAGEIPLNILAQIHFGMMICGLKKAQLVIYNPELPAADALKFIPIEQKANIVKNFKNILNRKVANA